MSLEKLLHGAMRLATLATNLLTVIGLAEPAPAERSISQPTSN